MKGFVEDIEEATEGNEDFRRVLYTGKFLQLVLMALQPGEEIGEEVHDTHDQFFRIEQGSGEVSIDGVRTAVEADDAIIVPAGARHNVVNTGDRPLKLYTIYGPPEHRDGVVRSTKAEAQSREEHFDGRTTEGEGEAARPSGSARPSGDGRLLSAGRLAPNALCSRACFPRFTGRRCGRRSCPRWRCFSARPSSTRSARFPSCSGPSSVERW